MYRCHIANGPPLLFWPPGLFLTVCGRSQLDSMVQLRQAANCGYVKNGPPSFSLACLRQRRTPLVFACVSTPKWPAPLFFWERFPSLFACPLQKENFPNLFEMMLLSHRTKHPSACICWWLYSIIRRMHKTLKPYSYDGTTFSIWQGSLQVWLRI